MGKTLTILTFLAALPAAAALADDDCFVPMTDWQPRAAVARLQELDDRTLKDIGINRCEIEAIVRESERPPRERLPTPASVTTLNPMRPPASRGTNVDASRDAPHDAPHGRVGRAA